MIASCGDSNVETVRRGDPNNAVTPSQTQTTQLPNFGSNTADTAGGIMWTVPRSWRVLPARPMRVATYGIGDAEESAECAVFFFGPGQGGGVQANIDRWVGQFTQPDGSNSGERLRTERRDAGGLSVTTVDLTGTYSAGGMGGQPASPMPGFRLMGAIIEAPQGPVFFKLVGADAALESRRAEFDQLINSIRKS